MTKSWPASRWIVATICTASSVPDLWESAYEVLMAESLRQAGLVLTYLRLLNLPLGLLMNFGQGTFKDGLKRVANDYTGPFGKT